MSRPNPLARAQFLLAAQHLSQLPKGSLAEVAIAGRSNAGKSTALNALAGHTGLARVSKTPGRTQQLVYFELGGGRFLVDLPGYGYARVPEAVLTHWREVVDGYFRVREPLRGLVVVMDIRHPLRDTDLAMLGFAEARGLPAHVLLSKADKLGRGQQAATVATVRKALAERFVQPMGVQAFSGPGRIGVDEARAVIEAWLELGRAAESA
jgi:GTP-binding protein